MILVDALGPDPHDEGSVLTRSMASFPETRWSLVLAAQSEAPRARQALDDLCRAYWTPVYAYIRQRGNSHADSEDLTQGFFACLLERGSLDSVAAEKGRLRTFLLTAVSRFMASAHERATAQRRGGGVVHVPIDPGWGQERFGCDPGHGVTPELAFEREWALRLLDRVLADVRAASEATGQAALFNELRGLISFEPPPAAYEEIAARLGLTSSAVKAAAHRLRCRYREILRRHIADTVVAEEEVDDEIQRLFTVFGEPSGG